MSRSRTVLVFDATARSRETVATALQRAGLQVVATGDSHEAIELSERSVVDVAIIDWATDRLDGLELAYRVKAQADYVPVIWVLDESGIDDIRGYVRRTDGLLTRPVDLDELMRHVDGLLVARAGFERLSGAGGDIDLLAVSDSLTGLYNRRFLSQRLVEELNRCQRAQEALAVLVIDLDDLRAVNARLSYELGDRLLREMAGILRTSLRTGDSVCRYGGDVFVAVLPHTDSVGAAMAAERLRVRLETHSFGSGWSDDSSPEDALISVTVSIGVAGSPEHGYDADALLAAADEAADAAKRAGKNRVVLGGR